MPVTTANITKQANVGSPGVTAEDVIAAIELILGRTPEQSLVDYHLGLGFSDRFALGRYMLSTHEFEERYLSGAAIAAEPLQYWEARAHGAAIRKKRLLTFGPYARAVLASTANGLFAVDPEDGFVAASLLTHGQYSSAELAFDASLVHEGGEVLVVGTHIGTLAIPLASHCRHLTALEANPRTFELLQANVRLSGATNITLHHAVAGAEDGQIVQFVINRDNSGGSKIMPRANLERSQGYMYDDPEIVELPTTRIDRLLPTQTFDLIVMDIEGSEVFALRGMSGVLKRAHALAVEFRPHALTEVAGVGIDAFIDVTAPYFTWMYVPGEGAVNGAEITHRLRAMFDAGTCHDAIYFFKDLPAALT